MAGEAGSSGSAKIGLKRSREGDGSVEGSSSGAAGSWGAAKGKLVAHAYPGVYPHAHDGAIQEGSILYSSG